MKKILFLACSMALVACSAQSIETSQKALIASCQTYALGLSTLADFRQAGKLSPQTIITVNNIDRVVGPICDGSKPLPGDPQTALNLIAPSVQEIIKLAQGAN